MLETQKSPEAKIVKKTKSWNIMTIIHYAIGLGLMIGFPMLDPIEPITEIGMLILGVFIGMVYLWSTVDSIWPSLLGLFLIGMSEYAPINKVGLDAFGSDIVIMVLISMVLFGAVEYVGCTQYLARWFVTREIINGKPYVFLFVFFLSSFVLSGLTTPMASLLILWPIAVEFMHDFKVEKSNKAYGMVVFGVYLAATLGQPMFPFKGAALAVVGTYQRITGIQVNYLNYVLLHWILAITMLILFMLFVRFIYKPDLTGFKSVNVEQFKKNPLPPMNIQQKLFLGAVVVFIVMLLAPSFLPATWLITVTLKKMGSLGVTMLIVGALVFLRIDGKPALPFKAVAAKNLSWDVYFLVAAAMYGANAVSNEVTGIKEWLIQVLQPLLGNRPEFVFVLFLLAFGMITTNFANNAGMAVILLPVVLAFAEQYPGLNPTSISMLITLIVFFAILTPAASPFAGMLHARRDLISMKEIAIMGFPVCIAGLIVYTVIGLPLAKIFF
ncbi:MAG: SLC13 family permease [Peptococcales bacterium]|jgi:sodium-dependent dicarboxylate transporter 2/3/5